jgi:hypothetical protein
MKITSLFSLLFALVSLAVAQTPYYDIYANLNIPANGEVTQASLSLFEARTDKLNVPMRIADSITGFNTGFGIVASVDEHSIQLDSIQITECKYSLYHIDMVASVESPVLSANGNPLTNIALTTYSDETASGMPAIFTTIQGFRNILSGEVSSVNGKPITASKTGPVGTLFITKHNFVFGSTRDFVQPTVNKGYIVRWDISFIPTFEGVQYPSITLHPKFIYKVLDFQDPKMVKLASLSETYPGWGEENGTVLQMTGEELEYFRLQRSSDLKNWTDWSFEGEGSNWINYSIPGDGGYYASTFEWIMFDKAFPNERRRAPQEFYRMVWAGKRGTYRQWSPTIH